MKRSLCVGTLAAALLGGVSGVSVVAVAGCGGGGKTAATPKPLPGAPQKPTAAVQPTPPKPQLRSLLSELYEAELAWQRKMLQTQHASWSELRHDTLLYGKQSYTAIPSCGYPDGYVEPYPALYEKLEALARRMPVAAAKTRSTSARPTPITSSVSPSRAD